jgi:hypothetical protein
MTTEHRTRSEVDGRVSNVGKRRTQRKCQHAASVKDRNSAVVAQKMSVAHMICQGEFNRRPRRERSEKFEIENESFAAVRRFAKG